jgi:hypothetical protein
VAYDSATERLSFDVTVQDLTQLPFATLDGATRHPDGVQVFFPAAPTVTEGSGSVAVANATGQGVFTASGQDYFQYGGSVGGVDQPELGADGILSSGEVSSPKQWQFSLPPAVETFTFTLYVATQTPPGPLVGVASPAEGTVARPGVRLAATCGACTGLSVQVRGAFEIAHGTTHVDTTVSLSAFEGQRVTLDFTGTDAAAHAVTWSRVVYVESNAHWVPVDSAGTRILDLDAGRILFADSTASPVALGLRDRATLAEERVPTALSSGFYALLAPHGAVVMDGGTAAHVREWRDGALLDLGTADSASLVVSGTWAAWTSGASVLRRDLAAGSTVLVAADAVPGHADVADNGDVVYVRADSTIMRYRDGVPAALTPDAAAGPVTDGINVVFRRALHTTLRTAAGVDTVLAVRPSAYRPWAEYQAEGGWVAWCRNVFDATEIWVRPPTGAKAELASVSDITRLERLFSDGTLAYTVVDRRYLAGARGLGDIGANWGDEAGASSGRPGQRPLIWSIGGNVYVALGRGVFRLDP